MASRWLILGLVASVALNLFLIGAAAGVIALGTRMARETGARQGPLVIATRDLPQQDRRRFRQMLVAARAKVAADTEQSRDLRLSAWGAIADAKPDVAAIKAKLAQSRQLDIGVRSKVEEEIVDYAAALPQDDRTVFADGMRRVLPPPVGATGTAPASNSTLGHP